MTKPLYFYNGTTFELVGPTTPQSPIAYQTSAPTAPATGDIWIDSDGDVDTYNRQLTRYYFVATAGQTTITGTDANNLTLAYVAGSEAVYVNGALQVRGQDYTATNGTSVVMSSGLAVNDVVEIFAYTAFTVANAYTKAESDSLLASAPGLRMVVPTSVTVGSGTGSVDATGNVTFTGASSISLNGCFTSTYDNYKIIMTGTSTATTVNELNFRLRVSGADNTTSNYYLFQYRRLSSGASNAYENNSLLKLGLYASHWTSIIEVLQPKTATNTMIFSTNTALGSDSGGELDQGQFNGSTSFDSASIIVGGTGTISGTIRVYGYKD